MGYITESYKSDSSGNLVGKVGSVFSGGADKSAKKAAAIQARSADRALAAEKETAAQVRADLQPFRQAGEDQLDPLSDLISNPQAQLDYVKSNPFFAAMADESQRRLLSNQAARGKVGSGGTAEALQTSLLLLGQDLLNNNISQRMGLTTLGANAAAGQASATQASGNTIVDLITGKGNVLAAGEVGAANARTQGFRTSMDHAAGVNDIVGTVFDGISLSDARFKEDIKPIGSIDSVPVYTFRYAGEQTTRIGVMAQDVEQTHPHAVQEFNGVKYVNYGELWR